MLFSVPWSCYELMDIPIIHTRCSRIDMELLLPAGLGDQQISGYLEITLDALAYAGKTNQSSSSACITGAGFLFSSWLWLTRGWAGWARTGKSATHCWCEFVSLSLSEAAGASDHLITCAPRRTSPGPVATPSLSYRLVFSSSSRPGSHAPQPRSYRSSRSRQRRASCRSRCPCSRGGG